MDKRTICEEDCQLSSSPNDLKILVMQLKREVEELVKTTNATLLIHDGKIAELCKYIKDNLSNSIRCLLDSMITSGEINNIITETIIFELNEKIIFCKNIEDLKVKYCEDGQVVKTMGYHNLNDNGGATYYVRSRKDNDIIDSGKIHLLKNGLVAELIVTNNIVTPEMFGCFGDGTNDDTINLQKAFNSGYKVECNGLYLVNSKININNDVIMSGDSYIKASKTLQGVCVIIMEETQKIGRKIAINVDANETSFPAIAIGKAKKCNLDLNVINASETGIDCNYLQYGGNNENIFRCSVYGSSRGKTKIGVLVNCRDSIFDSIVTKDCLHGVELNKGELIVKEVHCWLSNDVAPLLWDESYCIYDTSYYRFKIDWLYQDSVKYGIGGVGPYGHVDYFEFNNTLKEVNKYYHNYLNVNVSSGTTRLTIDRFANSYDENVILRYNLADTPSNEFGVTNKNGVTSNPNNIVNNNSFTDMNKAPQVGYFYVKYDTKNLPISTNGYVELKVIGSCVTQTYYPATFNEKGRYYMRLRQLTSTSWSEWKLFNCSE